MRDSLAKLVERRDRDHAGRSRLEPERMLLPPRVSSRARRICVTCREPVNEGAEHDKDAVTGLPCWCQLASGYCRRVHVCPRCGGELATVTT